MCGIMGYCKTYTNENMLTWELSNMNIVLKRVALKSARIYIYLNVTSYIYRIKQVLMHEERHCLKLENWMNECNQFQFEKLYAYGIPICSAWADPGWKSRGGWGRKPCQLKVYTIYVLITVRKVYSFIHLFGMSRELWKGVGLEASAGGGKGGAFAPPPPPGK